MKKSISMLIASAVALSTVMPVFAADTFKDVKTTGDFAWAYEYVENMAEKGLISGYEDGTFRPGNSVSRMEAFALFARIMGSNNQINKGTVELAKEKYADVLKAYDLSYAEGDVAFMLSRGVLSEDELDTYFEGKKKSEPMPRHEAAVLITKAMLAEAAATSEVLIDMDYTDVTDIPKNARQYVYYVSQKAIMSGMGNGEFSPSTPVRRSEIAVMMSKTIDSVNYFFEATKLVNVDTGANNIKIKDFDDAIGYNENTKFYKDVEEASENAMKTGQSVVLTYSEDDSGVHLAFVDIVAADVEETISGIFRGYSSAQGALTVTLEDPVTGKTTVYDCNPSVTVTINELASDINKVVNGAYVTLGLADEAVIEVSSMQKTENITGAEIVSVNPMGTITINHEDEKYDGKAYGLATGAKVYKNGDVAEFSTLYRGDTVALTLEYGVLTKIVATSKTSTITGVIKSYTISATPSLTIKKDGEELTYDIPSGVTVTFNGEEAKLADLEIGTNVSLTIESDAVKKISANTAGGVTSSSSITGIVTAVNPTANVIIVSYNEGGSETTAYLTCTNNTKYLVIPTLKDYTLKQIQVGDTVVAYGDRSTGIFVCSGVTVTPAVK